jgi:hypothetical protein
MELDNTSNFGPIIKLLSSNNDKICLNNNTITLNQYLFGMFDTQLINIKVFFITILIVASLVNKDYNFIKANPFIFSIEIILYSLCATIPFIYMEYNRKTENNNILKIFLITFFPIIITYILLQLSGFNTLIYEVDDNSIKIENNSMEISNNSREFNNNSRETFILINNSNEINNNSNEINNNSREINNNSNEINNNSNEINNNSNEINNNSNEINNNSREINNNSREINNSSNEINNSSNEINNSSKKEKLFNGLIKSILGTNGIIFILLILILVYSSLKINNFDIQNYETNFYLSFILEGLIFSICNSLPFIFISKNRNQITDKAKKNVVFKQNIKIILLIFITYFIFHILLQSSGFYNNTFGW